MPDNPRLDRVRRLRPDGGQRERQAPVSRRAHLLCRPECGGRLQPGPPAHRPDHRIGRDPQRPVDRGRARLCPRPLRPAPAARARYHRRALSPPGFGRPAAARHDRHGDDLPARPDHLRRADHGPRRDHPGRGAGGDPQHRRAVQHRRPLHHPRSGGGGPDGPPHHGAALRPGGRGGADARHADRPEAGLYENPVGGARTGEARGTGRRRDPPGQGRRCHLRRPP
jgi:hypothetical protein